MESLPRFAPSDDPGDGVFEAIFRALDDDSRPLIGRADARLLVIPLRDDHGSVIGGFWGFTVFAWLHVQMLLVPEVLRGRGVGSALMASAEAEARARGCRGAHVETFSFQAGEFYRKIGYVLFGVLKDYPRGYDQLYFAKRLADAGGGASDAAGSPVAQSHADGALPPGWPPVLTA